MIARRLTLGQFVQFNGYLGMLSWPMIALGWVVNLYQQGAASLTRVAAVMRQEPAIRDHADTRPLTAIRGEIEFRDVSLSYDDRPVLRGSQLPRPRGADAGDPGRDRRGQDVDREPDHARV